MPTKIPSAPAKPEFSKGERLLPFSSLFENDNETPIYVNRVHETFELLMHAHDFIEVCIVAEGTGFHYIGDEQMPVARGDLFLIPVGVPHVFRPGSTARSRQLIIYNCIFTMEQLDKLLQAVPAEPAIAAMYRQLCSKQQWLHVHERGEEGQLLFHKLYQEFTTRRPGYAASMCAAVIELLIMLYRRQLERETLSGQHQNQQQQQLSRAVSKPPSSVQQIIEAIDADCAAPELTVAAMAAQLGVSERQFQRSFQKATGMTFLAYVQSARIELSCKLLLRTDDLISRLALRAGYQDMKFFNRLFKKKTGMTPREYRASQRSESSITTTASK
ncbi:AraC family L-rhamnose operon transcriptional activator RhaR [Paenibacillus taihuensis]|uniref:AraC family L-rhamnose operon transcriptional activator RhaR n=1 Tax=Paenibacillus taihuensis TaxID=1156355 RepID=A0A3D9PWK4_9BACL|nr:helix-turn-helix domain-containing protein [Paenibacillus taihuensis]REE54731.1 AraC family L-rhamnose operon transcriptional activator RhaR [Paenibacillus taihuensis]